MKKFILPSIFAFGLLFSCNNDDDSSINSESIVGTWSFVKYQTQYSKDGKIVDEKLETCEEKNTLTFAKDNKYTIHSYDFFNNKCNEYIEEAKYKVEGNKLYINWQDDSSEVIQAEISKLTKNELIIKSDYGEDLDGDGKNEIDILVLKR
ncbi:lipocalin family protein [Empedobacter falsenii]